MGIHVVRKALSVATLRAHSVAKVISYLTVFIVLVTLYRLLFTTASL